ncbi:MAG: tripartite tricarboxylate transporter substrate binding protein [Betaproteobacteria bacterium]|nr:tripartite tricarboxylate transporter substrate binding protein [Betaproteobacteria bacterium]
MKQPVKTLVLSLALGAAFPVAGAGFPERNIRFIVPFGPGGGTDFFARIVGAKLTEILGHQVIIDNRPGAQGNIGTALGAKAAPDGYTVTLGHMSILALNPHLDSNQGFDALRDFAAVARGTAAQWVMLVTPSLPAKTVKELVALAKQRPGKLSYAATATTGQILGELFKIATGTDILHIPYKSTTPAFIDLMAGTVDMYISSPVGALPHIKAGKLRAVMIVGPKRDTTLPNVPSAVEAGVPDLGVTGWYGVIVPAGTPREVIVKLNAGIVSGLSQPDMRERLRAGGIEVSLSTPEEFDQQIRADFKRWEKIVKAVKATGAELR